MTPHEIDDDDPTTLERFREWRKRPAAVTNEHLLLSRGLWTVFLALSAWVGISQIRLDNQVTRERVDDALAREVQTCVDTNSQREDAKQVAVGAAEADQAALDSDTTTWQAIDAEITGGIPEPLRSTVFAGFAARQLAIDNQRDLIEVVYMPDPCDHIADATDTIN